MIQPVPAFTPHPLAPLYSAGTSPLDTFARATEALQEVLEGISGEGVGTSLDPQRLETLRQLLLQTGLVSLWFYAKFICGYNGPYEWLNDSLHLDMCNFRQTICMEAGSKNAIIVPRGCAKTSIVTKPGTDWEILRSPNIRVAIASAKEEKAQAFVDSIIAIFEENAFHQWLYPNARAVGRARKDLVISTRTRYFTEPTVCAVTAGGSVQGFHYDLFVPDDIIGDDLLDSGHKATAEMRSRVNWFWTNHLTLLASKRESRIVAAMTRYDIEDPGEKIMLDTKRRFGCWDEVDYDPPEDGGSWNTYYRAGIERDADGERYSINPYGFSVEDIDKLVISDPWTAYSQFFNNPQKSGQVEWASYRLGEASLEWIDDAWMVVLPVEGIARRLTSLDVVMAVDPGASETATRASTSRTALVVLARDPDDRRILLTAKKGYVTPSKWFDWMFAEKDKFGNCLRRTTVELVAGFKSLEPIIRAEQTRRGKFVNFIPIPSLGQKETTIRNLLEPLLLRGLLYATPEALGEIISELHSFPSRKMDLLDALKIAEYTSVRPESREDKERRAKADRERVSARDSTTGY